MELAETLQKAGKRVILLTAGPRPLDWKGHYFQKVEFGTGESFLQFVNQVLEDKTIVLVSKSSWELRYYRESLRQVGYTVVNFDTLAEAEASLEQHLVWVVRRTVGEYGDGTRFACKQAAAEPCKTFLLVSSTPWTETANLKWLDRCHFNEEKFLKAVADAFRNI